MTEFVSGRRVRFIADFDYKPRAGITIAHRAGDVKFVHAECASRAIAMGRAIALDVPDIPAGLAVAIRKPRASRRRRKAAT